MREFSSVSQHLLDSSSIEPKWSELLKIKKKFLTFQDRYHHTKRKCKFQKEISSPHLKPIKTLKEAPKYQEKLRA